MKVVSIVMRTESGDQYHFTWEVDGILDFVENVELSLGEEFEYICEFDINTLGDINRDDVDHEFRKALNKARGYEEF